ncbi:TIGR04141 family sporadically distributed protein [Cnuibacter physcomitrellae]|uniref:DUF6119 family protein n=1 Tax=Cnuibacter physcomitrellae TaxID=1619308 RepID=UPI002175A587|nr:DUF6119 family protein [Cnuibacter physcomitrellae]MCS5498132.1 TIGR04141 family sporadically distributed protein [Cnuibacter physcomitrellae]
MSIYALKPGMTVEDSLRDDHGYIETTDHSSSIPNLRVFLKRGSQSAPWWKEYLDLNDALLQGTNSAAAFVPSGKRVMVLTFGAGQFLLRDDVYEHDFGTRVVLNAVDPRKLKSTETLDPDSSQRRRTQIPYDGDLALLSFAGDASVLKSLTGKARPKYNDLVRSVTGSSSLRVTTPARAEDLPKLLSRLRKLYKSDDFLRTFPDVAKIRPITDPALISSLDEKLSASIFDLSAPIVLTVPDILDYRDESFVQFAGRGVSPIFDDVYVRHYREYLEAHNVTKANMSVEILRHDYMLLLDGSHNQRQRWSIYKSLVYEVSDGSDYSYHFSDGSWFKVATDLIVALRQDVDPYWIDANLPEHRWASEGDYNKEASDQLSAICLDKTNVSPKGQSAVEPCDILRAVDGEFELVHVKIGTSSANLSHLFNQAVNSAELLRTVKESSQKLHKLVEKRADSSTADSVLKAVNKDQFKVAIAIVSHKRTPERKSDNLPIFSRISLRRALRSLSAMRVPVSVQLVPDATNRAGKAKPRKPRTPALVPDE